MPTQIDTSSLLLALIVLGVIILIFIYITRAIFSIPDLLNMQKAQTHILLEIAKQNGVKEDVLDSIYDSFKFDARNQGQSEIDMSNELETKPQ